MSKLLRKFTIYLAHKLGYDIALIKFTPEEIEMQGDVRLLKFLDTVKYMHYIRKVKNIE